MKSSTSVQDVQGRSRQKRFQCDRPAAASTIEALMFSLRERGGAALSERACRTRLADLSVDQVRSVIARLIAMRLRYPNITDDLLFKLGEQL